MDANLLKPSTHLFPNQVDNVRALLQKRRALFTDHVGAGKTVSVLAALSVLFSRGRLNNAIVLTPLSAHRKLVWAQDIVKFTNFRAISFDEVLKRLSHGESFEVLKRTYQIIYGKHTAVKQSLNILTQFVTDKSILVCDEVHAFRNPHSSLTMTFRLYALKFQFFWGITGTSLSRSLEDTFNIIDLISPGYLGSFTAFRSNHCVTHEKVIGKFGGRLRKVLEIKALRSPEAMKSLMSGILVSGKSFVEFKFHMINYELDSHEASIYRRIANGINLYKGLEGDDWVKAVLTEDVQTPPHIKDVNAYSTRFLYLQAATDGMLSDKGEYVNQPGTKRTHFMRVINHILSKGQSAIVYVEYYSQLDLILKWLSDVPAVVLESSGRHVLTNDDITPAKVKIKPHIILGTRASSESQSLYFINNAIFFHIPTTPATCIQFSGRISRKNTLFPGDLHCWFFQSPNIEEYKLRMVSQKTAQMEQVQDYVEYNVPSLYKDSVMDDAFIKRTLLWNSYNE